MGPSVFTQCPEGWCVRPDVWGHCGNCGWWWLEGGSHVTRTTELRVTKTAFVC